MHEKQYTINFLQKKEKKIEHNKKKNTYIAELLFSFPYLLAIWSSNSLLSTSEDPSQWSPIFFQFIVINFVFVALKTRSFSNFVSAFS